MQSTLPIVSAQAETSTHCVSPLNRSLCSTRLIDPGSGAKHGVATKVLRRPRVRLIWNWILVIGPIADSRCRLILAIDLCNNPKTKEQKLTRARRLIPEWTIYDDEVAALARRVASNPTTIASERNALVAFGARADELEQAVQQRKERDEVLEEVERQTRHVKDEL